MFLSSYPAGQIAWKFEASHTMKLQRSLWAMLAAGILLTTLAVSDVHAQRRFFFYSPQGPFVQSAPYGPIAPMYPHAYNPYVAPYPAYGILPGPVILSPWQYGAEQGFSGRTAADYGYSREQFETPPRKRNAMYPAVPFEKGPGDRMTEIRRVRFEITVPREDAIVLIDGVQTKQTGLNRVFLTPAMDEDRLFTSSFEVRWTDGAGKTQSIQRTFEFVAGETIRHQFKNLP